MAPAKGQIDQRAERRIFGMVWYGQSVPGREVSYRSTGNSSLVDHFIPAGLSPIDYAFVYANCASAKGGIHRGSAIRLQLYVVVQILVLDGMSEACGIHMGFVRSHLKIRQ